jgi:hypothetical protein
MASEHFFPAAVPSTMAAAGAISFWIRNNSSSISVGVAMVISLRVILPMPKTQLLTGGIILPWFFTL